MTRISHELEALKKTIVRFAIVFFLAFSGLLIFPSDGSSFATRIFLSAKESLIPAGVPVVALGPVSSFVAPIMMAFLIALLATFPFGLWSVVRFLRPALRPDERKTLSAHVIPALILFYAGCALAYFVIIPTTFSILYSFAAPMGVAPLFALDEFISSVFFLTISVGFAFLLPVFMAASSRIGIIPSGFWIRHWRGAILFAILFSAVVTPDGSGVTMAFLSAPLIALYGIGAVASVKRA
ncbi:MAG: twin-arginine translocase subunit TatC [Candidatus Moranbacteria bacterium]|jgi:sec-independent protein translocase protein TatC|nr:twin-arginine translocase subunit TatC [Candidatus Moranbacteria bacterium]